MLEQSIEDEDEDVAEEGKLSGSGKCVGEAASSPCSILIETR